MSPVDLTLSPNRTENPAEEVMPLLAAHVEEADRTGYPAGETLAAIRTSELPGLVIPKKFGGSGETTEQLNRRIAEVAYRDPSTAIIMFQHMAVCSRIVEWGTAEQQWRLLPKLASGDWLAASAWSESNAGADKKALSTTASQRPDSSWTISGGKAFTTGAGLADIYLVLAQTTRYADDTSSYGAFGQSFFVIPAETPGIKPDTSLDLIGMRSSATGFVELRDCVVAAEAQLGPRDEAHRVIAEVKRSGATLGAVSVGIAESAWDLAFGVSQRKGLLAQQAARHRLVDLRSRIEAARGIVERAGQRDSEEPGALTLQSKIFASQTAEEVIQELARLLGSTGYLSTNPINRMYRDAKAVALMGPTNDLSRELVSLSWEN
jgi:alkylation response protein AidB-like acyl-CoA dehydrogenase